ncbi:MAG: HAD family hydrolase [Sphaerochaetaceae bacterium]|nr:HAD family hydrolase [Sphaerochaetaceae bacterium]
MEKKRAVIFDLDGTILETTADIGLALGKTFGTVFTDEQTASFVGRGLRNAVIAAASFLGIDDFDADILTEKLIDFYRQVPVLHTHPFPGVVELLRSLNAREIPVCVYSNKEQDLAEKVLGICFPDIRFSMIVGMHGGYEAKPSSQAVDAFCKKTGIEKADMLYVGDSEVDFKTAENSGVDYLILTWGMRSKENLLGSGVPQEALIPDLSGLEDYFI